MDLRRTIFIVVLAFSVIKAATLENREKRCQSRNCKSETEEIHLDHLRNLSEDAIDIDLYEAFTAAVKRGCSSPMCWFRPGGKRSMMLKRGLTRREKRKNHKRSLQSLMRVEHKREEMVKQKKNCASPMCWFRATGKRREMMSQRKKELFVKRMALKRILKGVKDKQKREQEGETKTGCSSPMCWFRAGREMDNNNDKILQPDNDATMKQGYNEKQRRRDPGEAAAKQIRMMKDAAERMQKKFVEEGKIFGPRDASMFGARGDKLFGAGEANVFRDEDENDHLELSAA